MLKENSVRVSPQMQYLIDEAIAFPAPEQRSLPPTATELIGELLVKVTPQELKSALQIVGFSDAEARNWVQEAIVIHEGAIA